MSAAAPPVEDVFRAFDVRGEFVGAAPHGTGHINDSYAVTCNQAGREVRYFMQRINGGVFRDVPALMDNVARVTAHQHRKLREAGADQPSRRALTIVPTRDGRSYAVDTDGSPWRMYLFVEGAHTCGGAARPEQAEQAARAFGLFQTQLADLPGPRLAETIPDFHNTPERVARFERALAEDRARRAAQTAPEIETALRLAPMASRLVDLHARGLIPERIAHNDTKVSNVLLDDATGLPVCVVDLDTVMPGLALYDFGDLVRSATNAAREDERDLSAVSVRLDVFDALVRGYLATTRGMLVAAELDHLVFCGRLITYETGLRFLTDFLNGDVYFKTRRPGQNLDRCRAHFRLAAQMEEHSETMEAIVASHRRGPADA